MTTHNVPSPAPSVSLLDRSPEPSAETLALAVCSSCEAPPVSVYVLSEGSEIWAHCERVSCRSAVHATVFPSEPEIEPEPSEIEETLSGMLSALLSAVLLPAPGDGLRSVDLLAWLARGSAVRCSVSEILPDLPSSLVAALRIEAREMLSDPETLDLLRVYGLRAEALGLVLVALRERQISPREALWSVSIPEEMRERIGQSVRSAGSLSLVLPDPTDLGSLDLAQ